jgi:hypothetical protein
VDFHEISQVLLTILILLPLLVFFSVFFFVYAVIKLEATPTLEPVDTNDEVFGEVAHYFTMVQTSLVNDGFDLSGVFLAPKLITGTQSLLMLLTNPHARDLVLVNATFVTQAGSRRLHACFLEIETEFEDDFKIDTINQEEAYPFAKRLEMIFTQLPSVGEPRELYRIHRRIVEENAGPRRKRWKWTGQPLQDLQRDMTAAHGRLAERGYLRLDAEQLFYRMTVKGTLAVCFRVMWPFSLITAAAIRRQERRLLEHVRQRGFGRVD